MTVLFINTAFKTNLLAIFDDNNVLDYQEISSNEFTKKSIKVLDSWYKKFEFNKILVNKGPGRFISLRSGIVYANTLANFKNLPLYIFSSYDYFSELKNLLGEKDLLILQQVNSQEILVDNQKQLIKDLPKKDLQYLGEVYQKYLLPEEFKEIKTDKNKSLEFFKNLFLRGMKTEKAEIDYLE
jgi:tRNA A37 threonylcarbamoyladenosine modification protein TsaB